MNVYCEQVFRQIYHVVQTTIAMSDSMTEEHLSLRPHEEKHSVGELLCHLVTICAADLIISEGATKADMDDFYTQQTYGSLEEMKRVLLQNYHDLYDAYEKMTNEQLHEEKTAYWGVTYTRFEWLLEILTHLTHHRGQLHAILVHFVKSDLNIPLFE